MTLRHLIAVPAATLIVLIGAGCGSSPSSIVTPTTIANQPSATPVLPAYDPPRRFSDTAVDVGSGPVALAGGIAYSYTDTSLVATALATGTPRWSVPLPGASGLVTGPTNQDENRTPPSPQIVTDAAGGNVVVAVYPVSIAGSGTQQDKSETQVIAVDPTGQTRWRQTLGSTSLLPRVVGGVHGPRGAAVVVDAGAETAALDASTGTAWWTTANVQALGVNDDMVIAVQSADSSSDWTGIGLRGGDGTQSWTADFGSTSVIGRAPTLVIAGSGRAVVTGPTNGATLIDTTTGKTVSSFASPRTSLLDSGFNDCAFDSLATVVCWEMNQEDSSPAAIAGFDRQNGHSLWQVTDQDPSRTTSTVTCAYKGVVYGNGQHGAVELDAHTGNDLVVNPGLAPTQVTAGWGLVTDLSDPAHRTAAYRATG
jgi:outer membrane protein assembly factor BamB